MGDDDILREAALLAPWGHSFQVRPDFWIGEGREPDWRVARFTEKLRLHGIDVSKSRILDLACLDGRFGVEFGKMGAEVVGVDIRPDNVARAQFAAKACGLPRVSAFVSDVMDLKVDQTGQFDVILCCGLLYHMTAGDAVKLMNFMRRASRGAVLLDTHISLEDRILDSYPLEALSREVVDGESYSGRHYVEFAAGTTMEARMQATASSVHNDTSFWFTDESLTRAVGKSGFKVVERFGPRDGMDVLERGRPVYFLT